MGLACANLPCERSLRPVPDARKTTALCGERTANWRAAVLLGVITSTYSTLFVSLGGARVGRDVGVARLMIAAQRGEIEVLEKWWRSWFRSPMHAEPHSHHDMPGMLTESALDELGQARGATFDQRFIAAMAFHHRGAIAMADEALVRAGDVRLKLMSHAIRFQQRGEIALMQGATGPRAVALALAVSHLFAPWGSALVDRPLSGERGDAGDGEPSRDGGQPC